jgi:DNA polymerase V
LFGSQVPAGFPSPADDHLESELDLNEYLINHPSETFFVRAKGDSMQQAGIFVKDLLIVDRSISTVAAL